MLSIETYDESADSNKTALVKVNDHMRSNILGLGMVTMLFFESLWMHGYVDSLLAWRFRFCYALCLFIYYRRSVIDDKNTIIASDKGLYFALSSDQGWRPDQYMLLEWENINRCEYRQGLSLEIKTNLVKEHRDNYVFEGIALVDLRLENAGFKFNEFFEKYVLITLPRDNFKRWFKLMKRYPIHVKRFG